MRVAVDAMGGDHAPAAPVAGAVMASRELGARIWLVGHEDVLRGRLAAHDVSELPIVVHHAPDVIGMDESPVAAIRRKPRCSMRVAFELLRDGTVDAIVSAGNSGAVMTGALFTLGGLPGIDRPAIAVSIPAVRGHVILIDAGASVDTDAENLVQFAVMGSIYAELLSGVSAPRVGILSNGQEEGKGTEVTRAASRILRETGGLNFVGYVEGRDVCQGAVEVVVCDGFVGNAVLKAVEGFGAMASSLLEGAFRRTWRSRLGYLLARPSLREMRRRLDYAEYGGAPLLGVAGVTIVAHGSSGPLAVRNAIRAAHDSARLGINRRIVDAVRQLPPMDSPARRRRARLWAQLKGRFGVRDGELGSEEGVGGDLRADEPPAGR
jgi:glycerol-3-phosphate acyltransferase PlsX